MILTGAQIICTLLEKYNVDVVFGIPGGAILPLYDALSQARIDHILARHEQGAGFMAQGYARATGKVGVVIVTSGPGVSNVITAIADANSDSIPMICLCGQVPQSLIGTDAFQEIPTIDIVKHISKTAWIARRPEDLLHLIPEAFRVALSGRPGPIVIDIPKDVQVGTYDVNFFPSPCAPDLPLTPSLSSIEQACELIKQSAQPLIYMGGGVVLSGCGAEVQQLAEQLDIPIVQTLMALGAIPHNHRLLLGMMGMHAKPSTNHCLALTDLLIVIGARFDDRATGKLSEFCPRAKVIHIDSDSYELGKLRIPNVSIHADASEAVKLLLKMCPPQSLPEWHEQVNKIKEKHGWPGGHELFITVFEACNTAIPQAIITTDVGQHQMWAAQHYPFTYSRQWLTSGGQGTMGFGFPAAIGAAFAYPNKPILCITGDGSFLMNIQELSTLVDHNLNVKILLFDNKSLGLVHQQQDLFYGGRRYASEYITAPKWIDLLKLYGIPSYDLIMDGPLSSDQCSLSDLTHILNVPGPVFIRLLIDNQAKVFPMVGPGKSNSEMILK